MIDVLSSLLFVSTFLYLNWRLACYVWAPEANNSADAAEAELVDE